MKRVLKIVANKYFITALGFVVWSLFFDQNDWFSVNEKQNELNELKGNITYLEKEISALHAERIALNSDAIKLEDYARETYRMKRENEDVYVIEEHN